MICHRCLYRIRTSRTSYGRLFSTTSPSSTDARVRSSPRGPPSGSHEGPPAATSTSAAQPFSTPLTSAPGPVRVDRLEKVRAKSSVSAGTPLRGLGYFKGRDPPVAMEDHEYPEWLWALLDKGNDSSSKEGSQGDGDAYGMVARTHVHLIIAITPANVFSSL